MWFNQNPDNVINDEPFLHATYWAGLQAEKFKVLKQAKEAIRTGATGPTAWDGKKDGQSKNANTTRKNRENQKEQNQTMRLRDSKNERIDEWGSPGNCVSKTAAMEGVTQGEQQTHRANKDCYCCGWTGYRAAQCYAGSTKAGTNLPPLP